MRDSQSNLHSDDWWEMIAILFLCFYAITFIGFMIAAWFIEYTSIFTRVLGLFFGFLVYIYTAGLITFGLMVVVNIVRDIRDQGYTKQRGILIVTSIIFFVTASLVFEFLYWGITADIGLLLKLIIPTIIVCVPCAVYLIRYIAGESEL